MWGMGVQSAQDVVVDGVVCREDEVAEKGGKRMSRQETVHVYIANREINGRCCGKTFSVIQSQEEIMLRSLKVIFREGSKNSF